MEKLELGQNRRHSEPEDVEAELRRLLTPVEEVAVLEYAEVAIAPCATCGVPWHTHLMALEAGGYRCPRCELEQGASARATREARARAAGLVGMTVALLLLWSTANHLPMPRWMLDRLGGGTHMLPMMTLLVCGGLAAGASFGALRETRQAAETVGPQLTRLQRVVAWLALAVSLSAVLTAILGLGPA